MKLKKFPKAAMIVALGSMLFTSCKSDNNDEPETPTDLKIAENIVGNWLLASSTPSEWATYEFTETSRINATTFEKGKLLSGTGFYFIDEAKASITGSYEYDSNQLPVYIDWIVENVQPFELTVKLYDNNDYLGNTSLYRIVSTVSVEAKGTSTINFKGICGTDDVSDFNVVDESVAEVSSTGEVSGLKIGDTYLTFKTPGGYAALKIEVTPAPKTFAELIVGSWIYDKLSEKEWQKTTFTSDGFVNVLWANPFSYSTIETADGYYTTSDKECSFSVKTPYNLTFNQRWMTEEITDFIWTYQAFSDGESVGKYTGHRLLGNVTLKPGEKATPKYADLTFGYDITGYSCNDTSMAKVNEDSGEITAVSKGRTYVNVKTAKGAGYYEVIIE